MKYQPRDAGARSKVPKRIWAATALWLAIAGCKGDPAPSERAAVVAGSAPSVQAPAAPAPAKVDTIADACKVFSEADVSAAFGVAVKQRASDTTSQTSDGLPLTTCKWEQGDGNPTDLSVHFQAENFLTEDPRAKAFFNDTRVTGGSLTFAELPGLGDEAIYQRMNHAKPVQARIGWRKRNIVFTLGVVRLAGIDVADAETKLRALAALKY